MHGPVEHLEVFPIALGIRLFWIQRGNKAFRSLMTDDAP